MTPNPEKISAEVGRRRGSGVMSPIVKSLQPDMPVIIPLDRLIDAYGAANALGYTIQSCKRDLPGLPKLPPNSCRIWRIFNEESK